MKRAAFALLSVVAAAGCGEARSSTASWVSVVRDDLVLEVDVTGQLRATRTTPVGPPPTSDIYDFKIVKMENEGVEVKKGKRVLTFDTAELEQKIADRTAERDSVAQEIVKKKIEIDLARRDGEMRVAEAEAARRKAALRADLPAQYTAAIEVTLAKLELEAAEAELRMARQRLDYLLKLGEAEVSYLRDKHAREALRLRRSEDTLAQMEVNAPVDGLVIYRPNWKGEKKKIGDTCWLGEGCIDIVDVSEMMAMGEVEETESSRIAIGQPVQLRLEAQPEMQWSAQVKATGTNVFRQSPKTLLKVVGVELKLARTDKNRMRPGMLFRGKIETDRISRALLVPLEAVFVRPEGPIAFRQTSMGSEKVNLRLGRRNQRHAEVLAGLSEGDRLSKTDVERQSER